MGYNDAIMGPMASPITSLALVYSSVYSGADQREHQNSASLAFVQEIHRWPVNSRTEVQQRGKCFHLMTSSWAHFAKLGVVVLEIPYPSYRRTLSPWWRQERFLHYWSFYQANTPVTCHNSLWHRRSSVGQNLSENRNCFICYVQQAAA